MTLNPFLNDDADTINRAIWSYANYKNKCTLASVVAVNSSPVSVDVQPLVQFSDINSDGKWRDYPVLREVPLAQAASATYAIKYPINDGDTGFLLFCDREIFTALGASSATITQPAYGELDELQACIFVPMLPLFQLAPTIQQNGVDFVSSNVSLLAELQTFVQQLLDTLTGLQTFDSALIAAGAPYAGAPSAPMTGSYAIAVTAAANSLNTSIATITSSCNTILAKLEQFVGDQ